MGTKMKILLINAFDNGGGAAISCLRLTTELNRHGVFARLGVPEKKSVSPYVFELPKKKTQFSVKIARKFAAYFGKVFSPFTKHFKRKFITTNRIFHSTNFFSETDVEWINDSDFDVVNLHWINGAICNKDIAKIRKPIVWTMHDSWPCCGAEHHPNIAEGDTRWKEGYFSGNKPKTTSGIDLCRKVWNQKKKYFSDLDVSFVAPSNWECDILKSSALFGKKKCTVIPNIIPKDEFYMRNKNYVKELFNIPKDKIIIGFGAAYNIDDPKSMKGSHYLIDALKKLAHPENYFIILFGPAGGAFTSQVSIQYFDSGYISNTNILASLYSACDCIINPSLIENLSTICLEAVFCSVPVAAFDVGGTGDIVQHKFNGYLAKPYDSSDLANGIVYCTEHYGELSENCAQVARRFDTDEIIKKYYDVYEYALNNSIVQKTGLA